MARCVSKSEFARMKGITPGGLAGAIRRGEIEVDSDGRIDADREKNRRWQTRSASAVSARTAGGRQMVRTANAEPVDDDAASLTLSGRDDIAGAYLAAKTKKEQANAELAHLAMLEKRGELVDAADVLSRWVAIGLRLREVLANIPARAVPLIRAAKTDAEGRTLLDRMLREVLAEVSEEQRRLAATAKVDEAA